VLVQGGGGQVREKILFEPSSGVKAYSGGGSLSFLRAESRCPAERKEIQLRVASGASLRKGGT